MLNDLRYSTRSLTRTPGLAATLVLTIAFGIGSNAVVHGFVRGLLARDIPIDSLDGVVSIVGAAADGSLGPLSYDEFVSLERQRDTFAWVGAARESLATITMNGHPSITAVTAVTSALAALIQISPGKGAVVSHRLRQNELRTTSATPDERLHIDDNDVPVVGVAPEWLDGLYLGRPVDVWMPFDADLPTDVDRTSRNIWVIARLRTGVSIDRAEVAINATSGSGTLHVFAYTGMTPDVAAGLSRIGVVLRAAAAAVLLIACANVVALLLSRAWARSRETAVRVALGARRTQLARLLLSDGVLISLTGGAVGIVIATWTIRAVPLLFFAEDAAQLIFAPDISGILIASAVCVGITIACGLVPLFEMRADRPATVLQRESIGPSKSMRHLRMGLVIAQIALCCVLVITTALLVENFRLALEARIDARLGVPVLATIQSRPSATRAETVRSGLDFFRAVEDAAASVIGVTPRAWVATLPAGLPAWQRFRVEPRELSLREMVMDVRPFTLADIIVPPVSGRLFGGQDTPHTCRVAIVDQAAAHQLFGGHAVGRSIDDPANQKVEIVGVVAMRQAKQLSRPAIYYYAAQASFPLAAPGPARFRVPTPPLDDPMIALDANVVSANYFDVMGWPLERGQLFADDPARGCRVALINKEAQERYFGGNAVGAAVIDQAGRRTEIIGVVNATPIRTLQRRVEPAIYFSMAQDFLSGMTLILNARDASRTILADLRRRFEAVPGRGPAPVSVRTFESHLSRTALAPLRIATTLVGASAAMAIALGVIGLYAAMTDTARQRRREIAVRIALGAPGWRVIRHVVLEGVRLASVGTLAGLLVCSLLMRFIRQITPGDAAVTVSVWLAGPLVLIAAVALASIVPAKRAVTLDPITITRVDN